MAVLALAGCQSEEPAQGETSQATSDPYGDWLERLRHTPLENEVAINDEYEISAVFPKGSPVCTSDSGGHLHGFYQWLESDCTKEAPGKVRSSRFIAVWADYNAAEYSRDMAAESTCSDPKARGAIDVTVPGDRGWTISCRETGEDGLEQTIVAFFAKAPEAGGGFGPDEIHVNYTVTLGTDATHRDEDMRVFKDFLSRLSLADTRLTLAD